MICKYVFVLYQSDEGLKNKQTIFNICSHFKCLLSFIADFAIVRIHIKV